MDEVISLIEPLYTKDEVTKIDKELSAYIQTLPRIELQPLTSNWYKNSSVYLLYPDCIPGKHHSPLQNIKPHLQHVKALGCNAIHLLPFLESPMQDKGFDISDYYKIRNGLGTMQDLAEIMEEADALGIHMFMDLVFNHVSTAHEWFIKAENGDAFYRNFFIHTKEKPHFLGKIYKQSTVWAEYLVNGEKTQVSIAFPEFAGELPHWILGKDGYWYYHTYYPSQIDINWKNPEVFIELTKVLLFWASKGFHFRLDAIPFIGKSAYKHLNTHNPFTHHLTAVFNVLAHQINPNCIFILETSERLDAEIEYFGTANIPQAHMLYDFQLASYIWLSLVENNVQSIWKQLRKDKHIPNHAQWINFLRNHDELSIHSLNPAQLEEFHKKLLPFGKPFREGFGISGRTYSLLGSDENRFLMAYFLVASLPGSILIPYGDEYGMENIPDTELTAEERLDTRNSNRGILSDQVSGSEKGKRIFNHMSQIIERRRLLGNYLNVWPEEIVTNNGVFGARYKLGTSELVIFVNITEYPQTIPFDTQSFQEVANINAFSLEKNALNLGPYAGIWLQK